MEELIEIKLDTDKSPKKKKTCTKQDDNLNKTKILYNKLYKTIYSNLTKIKNWRTEKKSKYYRNSESLIKDLDNLFYNHFCTQKNIQMFYNLIYKSRFITNIRIMLEEEELKILNEERNKNKLEPIALLDAVDDDLYDIIEINVYKKITNLTIEILNKIKNKFGIINENLINTTLHGYGICKYISNDIIDYLKKNNFKIKTKKIFLDMLKRLDIDFIDIIDFDKINIDKDLIEHILSSSYLAQNNFVILNKIYELCKLKDKYEFTDILINLIINKKFYSCDNLYPKLNNIFNWILEINNTEYTAQFLNILPFLIYVNMYYDGEHHFHSDNFNYDIFVNNLNENITRIFDDFTKKIKNINIQYNIKDYDLLDTKIIKELYHLHTPILIKKDNDDNNDNNDIKTRQKIRRLQNKLIENIKNNDNIYDNDKYYIFEDDCIYRYSYISLNGYQIKKIYNILRLKFFNFIKNNLIKEKNIDNIAQNNIFKYHNFLLNYDEKIDLFKNIFVGKITNNNLKILVENHNQIADFLIVKHIPNEDIIKISFKVSNYNFIKKLVELKYNIKTSYLNYIIENKYIKEILCEINKFNTLIFDDNEEWIKNILYLNPNIEIAKCIYNELNEDIQTNFTKKIEEVNKHDIILLDKLDINEFKKYINKFKLKFKLNEIIKFNDYIKRAYLLDYLI